MRLPGNSAGVMGAFFSIPKFALGYLQALVIFWAIIYYIANFMNRPRLAMKNRSNG